MLQVIGARGDLALEATASGGESTLQVIETGGKPISQAIASGGVPTLQSIVPAMPDRNTFSDHDFDPEEVEATEDSEDEAREAQSSEDPLLWGFTYGREGEGSDFEIDEEECARDLEHDVRHKYGVCAGDSPSRFLAVAAEQDWEGAFQGLFD